MSRYFCLGRFNESINEKYPKITRFRTYFDPRNSVEKAKHNQLQLHPYGIVIVDKE
jgi:hypothetical protein